LIQAEQDLLCLSSPEAKTLFSKYSISVGSTGNLGLSIGIIAAALGFKAVVHMSDEAKQWKKQRLIDRGVEVIEHHGDYAAAVAGGRAEAESNPLCHFVDDEQSELLFLGYAACAEYLAAQLKQQGRVIDHDHPLIVYIPCGVGGAPGGICYGLKAIFADAVHCFFAEPVASPCMLVQLAAKTTQPLSVYDIGLDNKTEADGLAVGLASALVAPLMRTQLSGIFTVQDRQLYSNLYQLKQFEDIAVEPSAAAALQGPIWLNSPDGQTYLAAQQINIEKATHVIWSTGGCLVPKVEMQKFQEIGQEIYQSQLGQSA
jgi:D-serine dehydratase